MSKRVLQLVLLLSATVAAFVADGVAQAARPASATGVRLVSFTASKPTAKAWRTVTIRWQTGEEANLLGFNLYRKVGTKQTKLNRAVIIAKGLGLGAKYSRKDLLPKTLKKRTKACYILEAIATDTTKLILGKPVCVLSRARPPV